MVARGFLLLAVGLASAAASAKSPVNDWFCKVLKPGMNPAAAIAAFPLEKLPPAKETREVKTDDDGTQRTHVDVEAEGVDYKVTYNYAFKNNDVTNPYGFELGIFSAGASDELKAQMQSWLAEFGKPARTITGDAVHAGPPLYPDGPQVFSFDAGFMLATYEANWFNKGDIRYAADLCAKRK